MRRPEDSILWQLLEGSPVEWAKFLGALVALGILVWAIVRVVSRLRDGKDPAASENLMLTQIGELRREGHLTDDEYRSIKGRLVDRIEDAQDEAKSDG